MDITEDRSPNAVTLVLGGRLDGTSASTFESRLLGCVEAGDHRLIIDMADLAYISSVGLRVFLVAAKRLKPVDGRLALCALRPSIAQVFEIAGFSSMFTITDTREEAEAAVSAPAR